MEMNMRTLFGWMNFMASHLRLLEFYNLDQAAKKKKKNPHVFAAKF